MTGNDRNGQQDRRPAGAGGLVPPHDIEAEQSVLGAILISGRVLQHVALEVGLREGDFYRQAHSDIYAAMCALFHAGEPVDQLTVIDQLSRSGRLDAVGGAVNVDVLAGTVPNVANVHRYARIVRDLAIARRLLAATYEIQGEIGARRHDGEELVEQAERLVFALRAERLSSRQSTLEEAVVSELARLELAAKDEREIPGLVTGIPGLDRLLGGLQDGRLYVIAARPSMGKSLLALQFARHAALKERQRVLFASLEMSDSETAQRHLAAESGVSPDRLHLGQIEDRDWPALLKAAAKTAGAPFHLLDDGDLSLMTLRAQARQVAVRYGDLRLVVVDYLQLLRADQPTGNRVEDVSAFSRGLKRLARELRCPVIAVAQLNRSVESRPDKRPQLADLRESGQIEADADVVCMLYRDDYYDPDSERPGEMDILIRKNRQGRLGAVVVAQDSRLRYAEAKPASAIF
jgi:replicative DNA helicase